MKKRLTVGFGMLLFLVMIDACNGGGIGSGSGKAGNIADSKGAHVYGSYCSACHGPDGKLGLSGASNLAASVLSDKEIREVVTNGRRMMVPFKGKLSPEEIDSVASYVMALRK